MIVVVTFLEVLAQIVTLTVENVSIVSMMSTAWITETKDVEVEEGALKVKIVSHKIKNHKNIYSVYALTIDNE